MLYMEKKKQKKWTELANELNSFQGATKTVEQWQVVWRDLKSRTSIKAKDLRKAKGLTGNKAIAQPELTELELRVIGIVGAEYVEGSKYCADSIPDEENLLEELEHGNNSVLSATPQVLSVCTNMPQETSEHSQYLNANSLDNSNDDVIMTIDDDFLQDADIVFDNARNEIGDSGATQDLTNCTSKKIAIPKAATIPSFRTSRNSPYPLPKLAEYSNTSRNIHAPTSSRTSNSLDNNKNVCVINDDSIDCSQGTDFVSDNARNEIGDSNPHQNLTNCASRKVAIIPKAATIKTSRNIASKSTEHSSSLKNLQAPTSSRRLNRVTPQQLSSSREIFQSVAQKQADAEFMHAEAAKVQAEASKMNALAVTEIAHAIQKLADTAAVQAVNDSERIRVFEKLTTIMDNMLPIYLNDQSV